MSKSSRKSSTKTHPTFSPWWQESLANPRLTALVIMTGIAALVVHQLLPWPLKSALATLVTYPIVTAVLLVGIMTLGYFNWVAGLVALGLLVFVLLPYNRRVVSRQQQKNMEGFTSATNDNQGDVEDMMDTGAIKSLFQPGFLRKKLQDARNLTREVTGEREARNKMERFLDKRAKHYQGGDSNNGKTDRERFSEARASGGDKAIPMRRFNPGSEEDANLLLTMDAMDDIKDRIKYKYEDKKYLKRYIRQKLEEVVDLLDLLPADD